MRKATNRGEAFTDGQSGEIAAGRLTLAAAITLIVTIAVVTAVFAPPATAATLAALSDRSHKTDMLARITYKPRLAIFGGSRSMRIPPSFARSYAGLKAFNFAVQEGTTEDFWALSHHLVHRNPDDPLYVMWGLQPNSFSDRQMDVALVRDKRLSRYFPAELLASMGGGMRHTWANRRFAADGHVVYDNYDRFEAAGRTLKESLDAYIARILRKRGEGDVVPAHPTRAKQYFTDTLAYLNQHGCAPLIMIMPVHPRVIAAVRDARWDERRANFIAYLVSLQSTYRFTILDFTFIWRFGGDRGLFYDGVHMKGENCRRLLQAAIDKAPWSFGLAPAPCELLHDNGGGGRGLSGGAAGSESAGSADDSEGPAIIVPSN
jgi:hypothetical protein